MELTVIFGLAALALGSTFSRISFLKRPKIAAASLYIGFAIGARFIDPTVSVICLANVLISILGYKKGFKEIES